MSRWSRALRPSLRRSSVNTGPIDSDFHQSVEEGLLIALFGVGMNVKNRFIVRALRDGDAFDVEADAAIVKEELRKAAEEQRLNASNVSDYQAVARRSRGVARHQHDYRNADVRPLRRREQMYDALAVKLDKLAANPAKVTEIAESAREKAWAEISDQIELTLDRLRAIETKDADYDTERPERLRLFLERNLTTLEHNHRTAQDRKKRISLRGKRPTSKS